MGAKVCKIQKVLNFTHFNQKNTHISSCKNVQIYKTATVTMHICTVTVHVQMVFFILFFSLPLHLDLLLTTKPQNHPYPSLNYRSLFSSNNKITKPLLSNLNHRSRWYHPNTKTQKLKLAITHHNTKAPKAKTSNNPS